MKYLIILLVFLTSCYGPRKAQNQTDKALSHYPDVVARIARDAFPCVVNRVDSSGFKTYDSLSSLIDSIIDLNSDRSREIDSLRHISPDTSSDCVDLIDKAYRYAQGIENENSNLKRSIKDLRNLPPKQITITKEDSAKLKLITSAMDKEIKDKDKYIALYGAQKTIAENLLDRQKGKILIPWWVPLILLLLTGLYFRKSIKTLFMKSVVSILIMCMFLLPGCVNFHGTNQSVWSGQLWLVFWIPFLASLWFLFVAIRKSSKFVPVYKHPQFYYFLILLAAAISFYFGVNSTR